LRVDIGALAEQKLDVEVMRVGSLAEVCVSPESIWGDDWMRLGGVPEERFFVPSTMTTPGQDVAV
jgi:hypothetical protein